MIAFVINAWLIQARGRVTKVGPAHNVISGKQAQRLVARKSRSDALGNADFRSCQPIPNPRRARGSLFDAFRRLDAKLAVA